MEGNYIPSDCPFSIRSLNDERSLFLIRERDEFGEYPNIFARILRSPTHESDQAGETAASLIVLCDTGCGTNVREQKAEGLVNVRKEWNIGSFLEATINPQNHLPYLLITSHCHFDHILGIKNLNLNRSIVLSSAYEKSFITPKSQLSKHSLCDDLGITVPEYKVGIWAKDFQKIIFRSPHSSQEVATGITILQTPGHTPDSLTWYDSTLTPPHIFVGDSLYEQESSDTKNAKWGREPAAPTVFNTESNLADWQRSLDKVIQFVQDRNLELQVTVLDTPSNDWVLVSQSRDEDALSSRVLLSAAHVTVSVDAEKCLLEMKSFVQRILQDEVPNRRVEDEKGHEVRLWDDLLDTSDADGWQPELDPVELGRFSVRAPLFVIEEGKLAYWRNKDKQSTT